MEGFDIKFVWGIILVVAVFISNFAGSKMSTKKDIKSHDIRLGKHSDRMKDIENDVKEKQTVIGCGEWRGEIGKDVQRIESTFNKMDAKLDKYIFRNGLKE